MIDVEHLCPGCMGRWEDTRKPCPRCGFSWETENHSPRELPPFTILAGRYLLGTRIGAGGFGITYLGLDLAEEKPVAIKEFFPVSLAERREEKVIALPGEDGRYFREALRSFRKEAELLSRFGGVEGIVRYLDYVQENETAYLVMEYVEGENLKQKMRRMEAPFSQEEALALLYPILLAVDAMHRKNVLHRDISPENLILKPDGTLTLIDFGAAREYSLEEDENLTVILKRGYAPDEQYHSGSRQGPWTDLYACCAVLYQMVSGLLPQDASSRRQKDRLLPLDEIEGLEVTKGFARAIEKGMTIYATERYSSIGKLLSDLDPDGTFRAKLEKEKAERTEKTEKAEGTDADTAPRESQAEKRKKSLENKDAELAAALAAVQQYRKEKLPEIDMSVVEDPELSRIDISGAEKAGERRKAGKAGQPAPEEEEEEISRTRGIVIAVVLVLAIFAAVLIYSVGKWSSAEVPDMTGMTEEEARVVLAETKFTCSDGNLAYYEYNDSVEEGIIYDQYPEAGERVSKDTEVTIYISKGPSAEVPDVTGLFMEDARAGLEPDFQVHMEFSKVSADDPAGNGEILSQSLAPGEITGEGADITLTAAVKEVAGQELSFAEETFSELGFEVSVEHRYSDDMEKDRVIECTYDMENARAELVVSDGPEHVAVPDLRGMSEEEAQQAAADAGLTAVLRNDKKFYSEYSRGTVAYQHLNPGTEVEAGSRIYYDTSAGVPSRGSVTLEASTTSVTLKKGGGSVAVTFYTSAVGGCICYTPAGINAQMGDWFEGQPFKIYLSADEVSASGMTQVYIYTGKMAQGTDVVVDYVNIDCTVID